MRRGFTLLEMMIATTVFVVGFISVYSLFLAGTRYRRQADVELASAMAAEDLLSGLRMRAGLEDPTADSWDLREYLGDGYPPMDIPNGIATDVPWYAYPERPTLRYRFVAVRDLSGETTASGRRSFFVRLQLVDIGANPGSTLTTEELGAYFRLSNGVPEPDPLPEDFDWTLLSTNEKIIEHLRNRDLLHQWDVVVARRDALAIGSY